MDKESKIILALNFAISVVILLYSTKLDGGIFIFFQAIVNLLLILPGKLIDYIFKVKTARAFLLSSGVFLLLSFGTCMVLPNTW